MKIKALLVISFAFIGWSAQAQKGLSIEVFAQPGLTMGGEFDVDTKNGNGNPNWIALEKKSTVGVSAGFNLNYFFMDRIGVSVGLGYSHQGQDYKDYTESVNLLGFTTTSVYSRSVSLNYLKVPLQLHYVSAPDKAVSLSLAAGFYVGVLIGYEDKNEFLSGNFSSSSIASGSTVTESGSNALGSYSTSNSLSGKPYNSTDFGGLFGAGVQFRLSENVSLPIMLNYSIGFSDVKNKSSVVIDPNNGTDLYWQQGYSNSPNQTLAWHNSQLGIMLGLKIRLTH